MSKKILSAVCALVLVLGSAAALPVGFAKTNLAITASAETYGDFEYTVLDDGTVEITAYKGGSIYYEDGVLYGTDITIPAAIDGKKVTSIGENAFELANALTSITIPDGVTSIVERAFTGCGDLKSITIPDSVTSIGDYAFSHCTSLTSVTIPNGITSIGVGTFQGCESLPGITIPETVTSIGANAFSNTGLTSVTIPKNVTYIGSSAFESCTSLESITVDSANPEYSSYDGALYSKDKTRLIRYPAGKKGSFTIPNGVTSIQGAFSFCAGLTSITISDSVTNIDGAFSNCTGLESITIPNSVTSIGSWAFRYCTSLTSVTIPNSVTSIGCDAFYNCPSLKSITIPKSVTSIDYEALGYYDYSSIDASGPRKMTDFTIYGEEGTWHGDRNNYAAVMAGAVYYEPTAAETYAKENRFTFVILDSRKKGDLNGNGKIDASDLLQVKSHIKKVKVLLGSDFICADVDGNGAINAADLLKMKAHMKGVTPIWE